MENALMKFYLPLVSHFLKRFKNLKFVSHFEKVGMGSKGLGYILILRKTKKDSVYKNAKEEVTLISLTSMNERIGITLNYS
ncbi:MAG: hypothetical protein Phog2KO_50230 [Phototrophicaceae bacterium]